MRQFSLLLDGQAKGPFSEADVNGMLAKGEVTGDTKCCPAGGTEWEPVSNHFSTGSKLKVRRREKAQAGENERADVHLDQRKKLLIYGLADSVSIDQLDRAQAQTLIEAHERKLKWRLSRRKLAGVIGMACGLAIGLYLALRTPLDTPFVTAASSLFKPEQRLMTTARGIDREMAQFKRLKATVESITFARPAGGSPPLQTLVSRLKIDPSISHRLSGQFSLTPLMEAAGNQRVSLSSQIKVVALSSPMPKAYVDKMSDQLRALEMLLAPTVAGENPLLRLKAWNDHITGSGAELSAWILAAPAKEAAPEPGGAFRFEEVPNLDAGAAYKQLLLAVRINGDLVHIPWSCKFMAARELRSEILPPDHFLSKENYKVVDKPISGGRRLEAKMKVGGKDLAVERQSPRWHYLALARERDPDSIVCLVDQKTQEKFAVGQKVTVQEIVRWEVFAKPEESPLPPLLTVAQ